MNEVVTYLMFNGNCREAMEFYHEVLGGELSMMTYGQLEQGSPDMADKIMHAKVGGANGKLMASDTPTNRPATVGDNFHLSIDCRNAEEQDKLFQLLTAGGTVKMPIEETFWGARFGMLTDKFGVNWMLNYDLPKS